MFQSTTMIEWVLCTYDGAYETDDLFSGRPQLQPLGGLMLYQQRGRSVYQSHRHQEPLCHWRELFLIVACTFADDLTLQASIVCLYQPPVEVDSSFRSIDSINAHGQPSRYHYGHGRTSSGEGAHCTRWPVSNLCITYFKKISMHRYQIYLATQILCKQRSSLGVKSAVSKYGD